MSANRRIRVLNISYAIVLASTVVFYLVGRAGIPLGLLYFVWFGLISVFLVAQFWSYANDIYTEEQGTRLFAIIATGGALGAIFGPRLAKVFSTFNLLIVAGVLLLAAITLLNIIERRLDGKASRRANKPSRRASRSSRPRKSSSRRWSKPPVRRTPTRCAASTSSA